MSLTSRPNTPVPPPPTAPPLEGSVEPPTAPAGHLPPSPAAQPAPTVAPGTHPIEMVHVRRSFGPVNAVKDVSLTVPAGSILGLIGPSGSGKTTTIRLILGTLAPDEGQIRVLGEDPRRFPRATRERIGYMPQLFVLYPDLTARENVDFVAATFGLLWRRRRKRVREVLELVGLWDARNRRASDMSGGMQRRLELCCALAHEPALLVLDEPTAGIDPLLRVDIWKELDRRRAAGVTIVVTTQYVTEAEYCDAVALIANGEVIAFNSPNEVRKQALGGEVIEIVTRSPFDTRALAPIEGVVEIRQTGPRQLLVITDDAARATPRVGDAIAAAGGAVEESSEYRPSFDEVFATLVGRHTADLEGRANGQAAGGSPPTMPTQMRRPG